MWSNNISHGRPSVTANIIHRTFHVQVADSIATCFTIDIDGEEYIVTARHVVEDLQTDQPLKIFSQDQWMELPVTLVGHAKDEIDISVLRAESKLTPENLPVTPSSAGLTYGQDVFFLGFPYGLKSNIIFKDFNFPLPLVKKATVSCLMENDPLFFLDGHNNPGFSGGPVVFGDSNEMKVAGVVSGYRFEEKPIFLDDVQSEYSYKGNTGIIVAYDIREAVAIIQPN